jgi:hypothetical protein
VDVDPGEHVVEIRMGLSGSPRMHIHLRRSDTVRLWCWPAASPWQWMGDMLHGWIALERSPEESMPRPRLWPVRKDELTRDWGFAEPGERTEPRPGPSRP